MSPEATFLTARIAEVREKAAREVVTIEFDPRGDNSPPFFEGILGSPEHEAYLAGLRRHWPEVFQPADAQMLTRCDVDDFLVAYHAAAMARVESGSDDPAAHAAYRAGLVTIRLMASVHDTHPDYRQEWRP